MTIPSLLFALLLALLLGALYHLIRGGGGWHLLVYLLVSPLGFVAGHFVGLWRKWTLFPFGPLDLGMEVIGGIVFLVIADYLLHLKPREDEGDE